MKKVLAILFSLILALAIVIGLPLLFGQDRQASVQASITNEQSLVSQEIISYDNDLNTYNKIYCDGKLLGVKSNLDYFNSRIDEQYKNYEEEFPNTTLGIDDDCYIVEEKSFINFENVDDKIIDYLIDNNYLGVKTTAVEFSTSAGTYEIIYVKDINDFYEARDQFLLNFISEETMNKLRNGEQIASPTSLGSVEKGLSTVETISTKEAIVNPSDIFDNVSDIYQFLCYGRNEEREYYTVREGDTLQGVGYYFGDMSPKQLVMLNPDILSSETQVVTPGMQLNVTYYTSPITVQVVKENLSQQFVTPETPEYIEDESLEEGKTRVIIQEEQGIKNVLYKETWVNGVLQSGELQSENTIKQPKRGQIAVGTMVVNMIGTGNYVWPCDNPAITCHYGCYLNHTGTDFINKYEKYGAIHAVDSGVVASIGYASDMGNYCIIDHQNGIRTFYMHMYASPYVDVGDNVSRDEIIGQIGNTGRSDGAHVHLTFEVDGERVDACNYLPCSMLE